MKPIRRGFLFLLALALLTGFCLPAAADESAAKATRAEQSRKRFILILLET